MAKTLSSIGAFVALAGIISIVLYFIGWNLRILLWIDAWGDTIGWIIRIGCVVIGGVLFVIGSLFGKKEEGSS